MDELTNLEILDDSEYTDDSDNSSNIICLSNSNNINDLSNSNTIVKKEIIESLCLVEQRITLHEKQKTNLFSFLDNINSAIQYIDDADILNTSTRFLQNIKDCLNNSVATLSMLNELKSLLNTLLVTPNDDDIEKYNTLFAECNNKIYENSILIEDFLDQYIKNSMFVPSASTFKKVEKKTKEEKDEIIEKINTAINTEIPITDNNILLISEKKNKVFLPYTIEDLQKRVAKSKKYKSVVDVVNKEYIIPLTKYRNPIISRFRESYKLMRNKEKASNLDSLDLALELCFNSLLNPAVISACKNLDELDIYLDCLNSNELDKFNLFEIQYEMMPQKVETLKLHF